MWVAQATAAWIDRRRRETGEENLGSGVEASILSESLRDIKRDILAEPGALEEQVAATLSQRLCSLFLRRPEGGRPMNGGEGLFDHDPHWRDLLHFHEYFHGDSARGVGASHQTGWTGLVAKLLQPRRPESGGRPRRRL